MPATARLAQDQRVVWDPVCVFHLGSKDLVTQITTAAVQGEQRQEAGARAQPQHKPVTSGCTCLAVPESRGKHLPLTAVFEKGGNSCTLGECSRTPADINICQIPSTNTQLTPILLLMSIHLSAVHLQVTCKSWLPCVL